MRNNTGKAAKLRAALSRLPVVGAIVGRGLEIILNGREPTTGTRENGLLLGFTPRQFDRDLSYVAPQYRDEVHHFATITPQEIGREPVEASPEPAAQQRGLSEEDLRIARYLGKHGVEVYTKTADELQAQINQLMSRNNRGQKLSETEIDQLAAYSMRLEQLKGQNQ